MTDLGTDTATALALGRRERQEDALVADFSQGERIGFAVLSDGMGGHGAGDLASRIIVSEMFSELLFSCARPDEMRQAPADILRNALAGANGKLRTYSKAQPANEGMGGTLVSTVLLDGALRWISVGDSPLYLFRDGVLSRLNEDHSMAPQIDMLVSKGLMDKASAQNHPHRHCLTSAVTGGEIDRIDCPDSALELRPDDIILMASDGLQVLPEAEIRRIVAANRRGGSRKVANALLAAIGALDLPHQDNVSIVVIRMVPGASDALRSHSGSLAREAGATRRRLVDQLRTFLPPSKGKCRS